MHTSVVSSVPKFLADPQELDLEIATPCVFEKVAHLLLVRAVELVSARQVVRLVLSCQSTREILPRNRLVLKSGSEKFFLLMKQSSSSPFEQNIQCISRSMCGKLNSFLRSMKLLAKDLPQFETVSVGDLERPARGRRERHHRRVT